MDIWLVNPPIHAPRGPLGGIVQSLFYNSPPLGLAYIAAVLEREGHRPSITDCPVERLSVQDLPDLARRKAPDLVGLSAMTPSFPEAMASARAIRSALGPSVPICIGGPHVTANPEALLECRDLDFAVQGEGEVTLLEVARRLEAGRAVDAVPGVVTRRDDALHFAPPRPLLEDLDWLPMPARHLLPLHRYRPMPNDEFRRPKTSVISSRGCPFRCIFCDKHVFGRSYRSHSPARIVAELHHLKDRYGIRDVAFVDSTFTPNRRRLRAVLDAMEESPPPLSWTCSCRANVLDEELLARMRRLGCWRIRIAIESGNDEILRRIRKGISKEQFARTVRAADRLGFQVKAFFMVGHFGETPETIEESIRFACSLPIKDITVQVNTPMRGTPQYTRMHRWGTFREGDLHSFSYFQPVFVPHGFTAGQLLEAQKRFYRRFYLRPALIRRHLRDIRGWPDIEKYLRAVPLVLDVMLANRPR